ncbi:MAG TPA: hypothetical protein VGC24_02340, partial [Burkholderiaceae bacterium]
HALANGKTVVQSFYDAHFTGASKAANALDAWEDTEPLVDAERYAAAHALLASSARRAEVWRERTTEWMARVTGVPDTSGFVGNHAGRVEAESMMLRGFTPRRTGEPEDASGGAYAACAAGGCSAWTVFHGEENVYRIEVGYFDGGAPGGGLVLRVNGELRTQWPWLIQQRVAADRAAAERFVVNGVRLKPGDRVEVSTGEHGAVDFVEITRDPRWN